MGIPLYSAQDGRQLGLLLPRALRMCQQKWTKMGSTAGEEGEGDLIVSPDNWKLIVLHSHRNNLHNFYLNNRWTKAEASHWSLFSHLAQLSIKPRGTVCTSPSVFFLVNKKSCQAGGTGTYTSSRVLPEILQHWNCEETWWWDTLGAQECTDLLRAIHQGHNKSC